MHGAARQAQVQHLIQQLGLQKVYLLTPFTFLPDWPSSTVMLHNAVSDEMAIFRLEFQFV